MKELKTFAGIAVAGTLILSGLVGAFLVFFMGGHLVLGAVLLGIPLATMFGGLATT